MEETNIIKITLPWSEVLALGLLATLILSHANNAHPLIWGFLLIYLVIRGGATLWGFSVLWKHAMSYAQGVLIGSPSSIYVSHAINPLHWPAIMQFVMYFAASVYILQVDMSVWPVALLAISPHIFRYFLYNRILRFIGNPAVQEYVEEEMKFFEDEQRRNAIIQEEVNKVMPEALDAAKERWKEEGLFSEELNEHNQPVESDQSTKSNSDSND